jgi:hypothetical protein
MVAAVVGEIMRWSWPAYASVADAMTFTSRSPQLRGWYHFTFLLSLVPLTYVGGALVGRSSMSPRSDSWRAVIPEQKS